MISKKLRIFVAEDSVYVLDALKTLILEIGSAELIGHADDAATAAASIRQMNPDVVILDIRLAGGSGLDVLRSVRSEGSKTPAVIVFTSQLGDRMRRACLNLGANYVLSKTDEVERLAGLLRSLSLGRGGAL